MKRRRRTVDNIPDPHPDPLERIIAAEEKKGSAERDEERQRLGEALVLACQRLSKEEKGLLAAFLMDAFPKRWWPQLTSHEVGQLVAQSKVWVRVYKLAARRSYQCTGGPQACGNGHTSCAHIRGREVFDAVLAAAGITAELERGGCR
jgi:hypothetical protein